MLLQISGIRGAAPTLKIGRTGAHHAAHGANLRCLQTAVGKLSHAQCNVDLLLNEIHAAIHESHANIDARMLLEKVRHDGKKV